MSRIDRLKSVCVSSTLASGIDVGQGINVGPGKFPQKNKRRTLNTHVLCSKYYLLNNHLNNLYVLSNKTVGPGKNPKLMKTSSPFI